MNENLKRTEIIEKVSCYSYEYTCMCALLPYKMSPYIISPAGARLGPSTPRSRTGPHHRKDRIPNRRIRRPRPHRRILPGPGHDGARVPSRQAASLCVAMGTGQVLRYQLPRQPLHLQGRGQGPAESGFVVPSEWRGKAEREYGRYGV